MATPEEFLPVPADGRDAAAAAALTAVKGRAADPAVWAQAQAHLAENGIQVHSAADPDQLAAVVAALVGDAPAVATPCRLATATDLWRRLGARGCQVWRLPDGAAARDFRDTYLAAQVGLTGVTAVVADTGTLVLAEGDGTGRAASNLPPVHIALAEPAKLVPAWEDVPVLVAAVAALCHGGVMPRYLSAISGPSRTGDIGFQIVRGMHGPKVVHLVFWQGPVPMAGQGQVPASWLVP